MFEQKLEHIKLSGVDYPIKFDNFVLEKIQEMYGSVNEFELKLKGLVYKTDKDGEKEYDNQMKPIYKRIEPSIQVINSTLPLMIEEGCSIEGRILEESRNRLVEMINMPYWEVAKIIELEFAKCFETKN